MLVYSGEDWNSTRRHFIGGSDASQPHQRHEPVSLRGASRSVQLRGETRVRPAAGPKLADHPDNVIEAGRRRGFDDKPVVDSEVFVP